MNANHPPNGVTRIDLAEVDGSLSHGVDVQGVRVKKWDNELSAEHEPRRFEWGPAISVEVNENLSLADMCAWLEGRGYRVYRWPGGARAFWGIPRPVRSAHQIRQLRARLEQRQQTDERLTGIYLHDVNLAYTF